MIQKRCSIGFGTPG